MAIGKSKHQKQKVLRILITRVLTLAFLGVLIVSSFYVYGYLTTSDKLAVSHVDISGLNRLKSDEIHKLTADLEGQNILLIPLENYEARFGRHPRIRNAELRRVLPNRIVCVVEEREPVALVFASGFLEVDRDGMIMTADDLTDLLDLPIIAGLNGDVVKEGKLCDNNMLQSALATLEVCKKYGSGFAGDISEFRINDQGLSIVSLKEGKVLLLGDTDIEAKLKRYFLMEKTISKRNENAKLIDLRFEDQIVLRDGI